ncbi:MAG: hypothetical protein J6Q96_01060 [Bacteroidales bacterium]|nr:hypothetical protein [Bacteroidales bacterium]
MQNISSNYIDAINAQKRVIRAKADLYNGEALIASYTQSDAIKSIDIQRVGEEGKFFGFGVTHKVNIKLLDIQRAINLTTSNHFKIFLGIQTASGIEYAAFPKVFITEVNRDENTNELSITAYDVLEGAKSLNFESLGIEVPYTIQNVIEAVGAQIGTSGVISNFGALNLSYDEGANFEGTETLPEVLKAAAEATGTIYYINGNDSLVFKMLDRDGEAVKTITKANYIDLDCKTNRRLQTICNCTELGDNVSISTTEIGTTQYVRDNPFLELRDDIASILENLIGLLGNLTINQFECSWRGDASLEPADKIGIITKDNQTTFSFLLNDSISFNGGLEEETSWTYPESEETESNPSNLGAMLKQTFARVDKVNKQIDIVASETSANTEAISTIQLTTETINVAVQNVEKQTTEVLENVNANMNELTARVEATMTAEDVTLLVKSELDNGTSKVETATGFTFDENGLNISKTGSEMTTQIDEDGMTIQRDGEDVLIADHEGVNAYNLHAKTYLIVGESSRFEDYNKDGETRTGCFWIGGAE